MNKSTDFERNAPIRKITCVALSIANLLALPTSAFAAPITVVDGGCTLKDAIISANDNTATGDCPKGDPDLIATDLITLPDNSMQSLNEGHLNNTDYFTGLPFVTSNIIIQGNGSTLRRDSTDPFRLIAVTGSGNLTINNLTIENGSFGFIGGGVYVGADAELTLNNSTVAGNTVVGSSANVGLGGGLFTNGGQITLNNSSISRNSARSGGGIYAREGSTVILSNSTISANLASNGGGIYARTNSTITLNYSAVSANYSTAAGGGIFANSDSYVSLSNSTVSANSTRINAGGILALSRSSVSLSNSTVSANSTRNSGGGILVTTNGFVSLSNSTVSGNSAYHGGGIFADSDGSVSLANSIIANSSSNDDVNVFSLVSDSASIIEEASFGGSRTGDPGLFSLAYNGGPIKTHALKADSIARGTGILGTCTTYDQRGQLRDDGDGKCDVGAIEFNEDDVTRNETNFIVIPLGNGKAAVIPN